MKIKLKSFLDEESTTSDYTILRFKKTLMELKKEGVIFIDKPISMIDKNTEIDLYYFRHPGQNKTYDAFPMPKHIYVKNKKEKTLFTLMKKYREDYYGSAVSNEDILTYNTEPFIGKHTVWFSKKK